MAPKRRAAAKRRKLQQVEEQQQQQREQVREEEEEDGEGDQLQEEVFSFDPQSVAGMAAASTTTRRRTRAMAQDADDTGVTESRVAGLTRQRAAFFATGGFSDTDNAVDVQEDGTVAATAAVTQANQEESSWPGYYATARELGENRDAAKRARKQALEQQNQSQQAKQDQPKWTPRRTQPRQGVLVQEQIVPTLQELALQVLARFIDQLPSLEYVDNNTRHRVARKAVETRRMSAAVLPLFIFPGATEIDLPDCSNVDEVSFVRALKECVGSGSMLSALQLGFSGRCISDAVIMDMGDSLQNLEQLRLAGCYRLSDAGVKALVRRCAPSLEEFELTCNQRITKKSIEYLSELKQLHSFALSECPQLTDECLEPLQSITQLRKLSLVQMEGITDEFVSELVKHLPGLEDISLAQCAQLTNKSVLQILQSCRGLRVLDISDMPLLTDDALEPVRTMGHPLSKVSMRCCSGMTDVAIEHLTFGAKDHLTELQLSSIAHLSDRGLRALQEECSSSIRELDLSFCRGFTEDALGIFVDACPELKELTLFGCTQITSRFIKWHAKDDLVIAGHPLLTGLTIRN